MPYWEILAEENSRYPLKPIFENILYNEDLVLARLDEGINSVILSIEKWERILSVINLLNEEPIPGHYFNSGASDFCVGWRLRW